MKRFSVLILAALTTPLWAQQAEEDIREAKPLIEIAGPEPQSQWPLYALIAFVSFIIITALLWWLKRRSHPGQTAEEKARQTLHDLQKNSHTMLPGDFAMAASHVVRAFVEQKFGLAAPKRTTEEFLHELSTVKNESLISRMKPLRGFLRSCDMAKFAETNLEGTEREDLISKATAFIDAPDTTKPKEGA